MATNSKNRHKKLAKIAQKQKKRREKNKKTKIAILDTHKQFQLDHAVNMALEVGDQENWEKAERMLNKLHSKHKNHPTIHFGLGVVAAQLDRYEDSIHFLKKVIHAQPDDADAHYNLACAYARRGMISDMIVSYRKVIEFGSPNDDTVTTAHMVLASLEQKIKEDNLSLDDFLAANALFDKGCDQMEAEHWDTAIELFTQAQQIHPNHEQTYNNMGLCWALQGKIQEAIDAFEKAIELNSRYEPAIINLISLRKLQKKGGDPATLKRLILDYTSDYSAKDRYYLKELSKSKSETSSADTLSVEDLNVI